MKRHPLETKYIWMDGRFVPPQNARVHLLTHSLHYGSAVFEGERFYETDRGPALFRIRDHIDRFFLSASVLDMKLPYSKKEIIEATRTLIRRNKLHSGYIRPIAFYGEKMGLLPHDSPLHVAIAIWSWGAYLGKKPARVKISNVMRLHLRSIYPQAKVSGYYANSIFATLEARNAGYDEAVLLDANGYVAEGPGENIFIVKNGKLFTPSLGSILPGITRDSIITLARSRRISVYEKKILPRELERADELFFTGTAAEVHPIGYVGKKKIGNGGVGPLTKELKELYHRAVHGKEKRFLRWLTVV